MTTAARSSAREVFAVFLRLGLTSFGGPVAHLGYFREEFIARRHWLDERTYADMVALSQFLPGPSSSQVGIAVGAARAGLRGALAAWLGFTLPSALGLVLFATALTQFTGGVESGWLNGLKVVAVAVVARAVWSMARALCPDRPRAAFAVLSAVAVLTWPGTAGQLAAIAVGGFVGWVMLRGEEGAPPSSLKIELGRRTAILLLALFFVLLLALPVATRLTDSLPIALADAFYRSGALVFGGGHVILPLLQAEVVPPGWIDKDSFIAGYGAAQAVPGPLLTFSAYLGAVITPGWVGWATALLCLVAVFLPSFLLVLGTLPFWEALRRRAAMQAAMRGINAAVVGLLLAALYDPVWTSAIRSVADFTLAVVAFALLALLRLPPWLVVGLCGVAGALLVKL